MSSGKPNYGPGIAEIVAATMRGDDAAKLTAIGRRTTGLCDKLHEPLSGLMLGVKSLSGKEFSASPIVLQMALAIINENEAALAELWREYKWEAPSEKERAWNFGIPAARELARAMKTQGGKPLAETEYLVLGVDEVEKVLLVLPKTADGSLHPGTPVPKTVWGAEIAGKRFVGKCRVGGKVGADGLWDYVQKHGVPRTVTLVRMKAEEQHKATPSLAVPGLADHQAIVIGTHDFEDNGARKGLLLMPKIPVTQEYLDGLVPEPIRGLLAKTPRTAEEEAQIEASPIKCYGLQIGESKFALLQAWPDTPGGVDVFKAIGLTNYLANNPMPLFVTFVGMNSPETDDSQYRGHGVRRDSRAA